MGFLKMPYPSQVGKNIQDLPTPCLIVSAKAVEDNCTKMLEKAQKLGVQLRGQTKTHKTIEAGVLQTGGTKRCIVVSTLTEAEMYAEAGFDDILYGYPLLPGHMPRNYQLCQNLDAYHLSAIEFQGLYAHCGNSYQGSNDDEVKQARDEAITKLDKVAQVIQDSGLRLLVKHQGIGSTPSCSQNIEAGNEWKKNLAEIHPGNYVFYDLQQEKLGSCHREDIAARVLTRIIGHFGGQRNQMIIDAGFVALSQQGFDELGKTMAIIKVSIFSITG